MYYELIDLHNDTWMNVFKVDYDSISILNPYDTYGTNDYRKFICLESFEWGELSFKELKSSLQGKSVVGAAQVISNYISEESEERYPKANILFEHILKQGRVAPKDELDKIDVMEALS